jgi:hypothetical protein
MIELVVCHVYFSVHSLSLSVLFSLCVAAVGEVEVDTRAVAVATRARARAWLRRPGLLTSPQRTAAPRRFSKGGGGGEIWA